MFSSSVGSSAVAQASYFATSERLDFFQISKIDSKEILGPIEAKTGHPISIKSLTSILTPQSSESDPKFQQLCGNFLIFLMSSFQEINVKSEKYSNEGYGQQGSRMAFHRTKSIIETFKAVLNDPHNNALFFAIDETTGDIMGSISVLQSENGLPEISDFYLSKNLRRDRTAPKIGLAKYLFSQMLSFVNQLGHKEVFLTSRRKGGFEQALNLYSQFGFKEVNDDRIVRPEYRSPRTIAMLLTF